MQAYLSKLDLLKVNFSTQIPFKNDATTHEQQHMQVFHHHDTYRTSTRTRFHTQPDFIGSHCSKL